MNEKRLTRSDDRIIAGVLAGFAEYFDIDPTLVRIGYVFLAIFCAGFPAVAFYIVCWLIIPSKHARSIVEEKMNEKKSEHEKHAHAEPANHSDETSVNEPRVD